MAFCRGAGIRGAEHADGASAGAWRGGWQRVIGEGEGRYCGVGMIEMDGPGCPRALEELEYRNATEEIGLDIGDG